MERKAPFVVGISSLEEGASTREMVGTAADLELEPEKVPLEGPIYFRANLYRAGLKIEVQGKLTASLRMICDRCLNSVLVRVDVPVRLFAEKRETRDHRREEEVREDDLGMVYHDGQRIDLTDEVRQELLVQVPWHVVCRPDCKGLCSGCGVDLNRDSCSCAERSPGSAR